jgi:type IV secretion system protein TrbE
MRFENAARPFAEIAPWLLLVTPTVALNKDGSLLASFRFSGFDLDGLEQSSVDYYAALVEHGLRAFDERITLWSSVHRRRSEHYPRSHFPDPIAQRIDDIRAEEFTSGRHYINLHYLSVLYRPAKGADRLLDRFHNLTTHHGMGYLRAMLSALRAQFSPQHGFAYLNADLDQYIAQFEELLDAFCGTLVRIGLTRLENEALLQFFHDCCSPASAGQPVALPRYPAYLDAFLCDNTVLVAADHIQFDGSDHTLYATALAIKEWPDTTVPGLLDALLAIPGELTISQAFRFVEREAATKYIKGVQRFNLNLQKPIFSYIREALSGEESAVNDTGRAVAAADARAALAELTEHNRVYGYHGFSVIVFGRNLTQVEDATKSVAAVIRSNGFLVLREKLHLQSAWCGTIPGQWGELVRWHFINTANLADLCPVRTIGCGIASNPFLEEQTHRSSPALTVLATEYATPYYFNFHRGDLAHSFVVGPSRSGKSVFVNFLLSQFRKYHPVNIYIFDKDYSCKIPTLLQDGEHVDLDDANSGVRLNPLKLLGKRDNWEWLAGWVEILLTSRGYRLTSDDDRALWQGLENVASLAPSLWQLKSLYSVLPRALKGELEPWVGQGSFGKYFDNAQDSFTLSSFTCVEMGSLLPNKRLARAFMEYAFIRIKQRLDEQAAAPSAIYLEEVWFLLEDPVFSAKIREWLKTIPKKLAFVIMATQSIDDLAGSDIFSSISDNVPTRIFLPNRHANAYREMYIKQFGLNDAQINRIRNAIDKQQYYLTTPEISRMVETRFSPEILACLRSDTLGLRLFDKHRSSSDPNWKWNYIKEVSCEAQG